MTTAHKTEEEKREYFDSPEVLDEKVSLLAEMVINSQHMVAFTGAGISTACGIPDYRSGANTVMETGAGCWTKKAMGQAAAAAASKNTLRTQIQKAYPSLTHMAMTELMERNHLKYIVSQNVDGLHRKSGIPAHNLSELHGNTNLEICEDCGREYMRDHRVRVAKRCVEHRTGRKCENPGCNGHLKDTIINFGENLNQNILELGFQNCGAADLCISMGTSLRVSPANEMPQQTAQNGGNLVICNLQKTPLDNMAALVIHAKCDDIMKLLMEKLGYNIPVWQMKKRVEVSLIEDGARIQVRGVDDRRQPFHLFKSIKVGGFNQAAKVFPSEAQKKQPYKYTLPGQAEQFTVELEFMGHYNEKNLTIKVNQEELQAHQSLVYEMVMDSISGQWELVVIKNADNDVVGVANFTQ